MSVMITKKRARSPIALSRHAEAAGYHPNGVGGIDGHPETYSFMLEDYTVFITRDEWEALDKQFAGMAND